MAIGCETEKMTGQDFVSSLYEEKKEAAKQCLCCLPQGYVLQHVMARIKQGYNII